MIFFNISLRNCFEITDFKNKCFVQIWPNLKSDIELLTVGVLYWTRTWWSGVDDKKVKEGKRLIVPGFCSRPSRSRESARNRESERETRGPKL